MDFPVYDANSADSEDADEMLCSVAPGLLLYMLAKVPFMES